MKHRYSPALRSLLPVLRLLVLALLATAGAAQAQVSTLNESFDSAPPATWNVQNLSNPIGVVGWFQGNTTVFGPQATTGYVGANFNSGAGTSNISDWLLTPQLNLTNGAVLRFWSRTVASPAFADRLQVRLSTSGGSTNVGTTETSTGDFGTLLLDINPTLTPTGYPNAWTQYTVTISGLAAPTTGRVAFRYFVTNGGPNGTNSDYIGLDEVSYQAASAVTAVTWTGATSTDWATPANWSPAVVPTASISATIPAAPANQPLVTGTQTAQNVAVAANARLTLAASGLLTLGSPSGLGSLTLGAGSTFTQGAISEIYLTGNLTNNGATFALDATSEVGFGVSTLSHLLNGTAGVTFQTLTVGEQGQADNLSIQVPTQVRRKLGVYNNAVATTGTGGSLTLLSDATGTALVENATGGTVAGPVTVQRYIDPSLNQGLGYRHYSAPVTNTTVADLATTGFTPVVNPDYNTSATPYTVTPFPTVFGYNDSRLVTATNNITGLDKGYVSPAALSTPLELGRGYTVNIAANQVVDFVGTLFSGDLTKGGLTSTRPSNSDGGWYLMGNPYPAPLDYGRVAASDRTNLEGAMYVFSSTGQYTGRYRSYINGVGNSVLPVGQGFFVRVVAGSNVVGSLTLRNAYRLTAPDATPFQRTAAETRPLVQLTLQNQAGTLADEAHVYFEAGATAAVEPAYDAVKLPNPNGLNLATQAANQDLSINGLPAPAAGLTVPLAVRVPATGTYTLAAAQLLNLAGTPVSLRDLQLGTLTDLRAQPSYTFTQNAAAATPRFELVFGARVLATASPALAAQVVVFPNPAHEAFTVLVPAVAGASTVQGTLLNALGQVVRRQSAALPAAGTRFTVETSGLAAGVYTLRLQVGEQSLAKRVVID